MRMRSAFLIFFLFAPGARGAEVRYLSTLDYLGAVAAEIDRATSSVTACVYLFNLVPQRSESKTLRLANSLVEARERGARVEVILDGTPDPEGGFGAGMDERNRSAYDYLAERGVAVFFSSGPALVHAKTVVVDESVVIAGSNNWSEAALSDNAEGALLARDPEAARAALDDLRRIPRRTLPAAPPAAVVPGAFLTDPRFLGMMVSQGDQREFDVYLFLLKASGGQPSFDLDDDALAESLGIASMGTEDYRRQINKALRRLQDRYGLIRAGTRRGLPPRIELVPLAGDGVGLPAEYWTWGWPRALNLAGKVMYVLNRKYSATSPIRPRWSLLVETVGRENGLAAQTVVRGTAELKRANLVDVQPDRLDRDADLPRRPNVYTPLPLYDPAVLERRWKELAARYGEEKLARARRCLALVYKDSDADAAEMFIGLENDYGREKVDRAYEIIAEKNVGNPRRTVGYFAAVVKQLK